MASKFISKRETFEFSSIDKTFNSQKNFSKTIFLVELMHKLNSAKSEDQLFNLTAKYAFKIFDIDGIAIFLPEKDKKNLVAKILQAKAKDRLVKAQRLALFRKMPLNSNYSIAKSFLTQKEVTVQKTLSPSLKKLGIKTVISLPMVVDKQSIGVLALGFGRKVDPNEADLKTGEMMAAHLATIIYNLSLVGSLKTRTQWLQLLQENVRLGFSLIDKNDVIYYTNKVVGKLFGSTKDMVGMSREEVVKNWSKLHKYRVERFFDSKDMKKAVFGKKEPFLGGILKVHSKPSRYVLANYYPVLQDKEFTGVVATYRDITNEKNQEAHFEEQVQTLQVEKDRYEAIVSNIEEGICLINSNLMILHMNQACEEAIGMGLDQAKGRPYYEVFKCHTKNGLHFPEFSPLAKVFITKEAITYEEHLHENANGEDVWVGVSASPIFDRQGNVDEVVLVTRDMSSFKEIEKAKSEFVSIASHELRTPLTVVNGYLSLLRDGDLGDFQTEESRARLFEVLNKVSDETNRLTHLVSNLLDVSRVEENRMVLDKRPRQIAEVVECVLDKLATNAARQGINLIYDKDTLDGVNLSYDFDKLCQVLLNLIDNSMKFTPEGGKVTVSGWRNEDSAFISVSDTGSGIPANLNSVIFEKFQQVPGSYLKENRGTGLGLFIVKSLVELHGGKVFLESNTGRGTKVTFSLPL